MAPADIPMAATEVRDGDEVAGVDTDRAATPGMAPAVAGVDTVPMAGRVTALADGEAAVVMSVCSTDRTAVTAVDPTVVRTVDTAGR